MISYFEPNTVRENGLTYSVDMVRLSGEFLEDIDGRGHVLEFVRKINESSVIPDVEYYEYTGGKIGKYRDSFTFTFGQEQSATLLLCPRGKTGKEDWSGWALEFNPNKVGLCEWFLKIHACVVNYSLDCTVKRWDLAQDSPIQRMCCVLHKDQRKYATVRTGADDLTEYLGQRNKPGFVKLYNKQLERGLLTPLTRLELTAPFSRNYSDIVAIWPECHVYPALDLDSRSHLQDDLSPLTPSNRFIVKSILQYPALENELYTFDKKTRKKLDDTLNQYRQVFLPSMGAYLKLFNGLMMWLHPVSNCT